MAVLVAVPCAAEMRVVATLPTDHAVTAVAVDPVARRGYFAGSGRLTVVDLDALGRRTIDVNTWEPDRALVDTSSGRLYLTNSNYEEAWIDMIDASIDPSRADPSVGSITLGQRAWNIAADFGRGEVYVGAGKSVRVLDAHTLAPVATIPVPYEVAGVAVDRARGRILAGRADPGEGPVAVIDSVARTIVALPVVADTGWAGEPDWFDGEDGPAWPVADERTGDFYLLHASGQTSILGGPGYDVRTATPESDYAFGTSRAATSLAWGQLYRPSEGQRRTYANVRLSPAIQVVEAGSGTAMLGTLPGPAIADARTLIVDDDGGDLYTTTGIVPNVLRRLDPATLEERESLQFSGNFLSRGFRDPVTGRLFAAGYAGIVVVETNPARAGTRLATSFRHAGFDHRFVTADPIEQRLVDDGHFGPDWKVAPDVFRVWSTARDSAQPVCRFFSARFAPKSSHFYTPYAAECEALKAGGEWQYEGIVFHVALPDASGGCAAGTEALYRLYNQGRGGAPNHWYTASRATRDAAERDGWVAEGAGADRVFACTPALR